MTNKTEEFFRATLDVGPDDTVRDLPRDTGLSNDSDAQTNNTRRAIRAAEAVRTYARVVEGEQQHLVEPIGTEVTSLINCLRHLVDALGMDWAKLTSDTYHYDAEVRASREHDDVSARSWATSTSRWGSTPPRVTRRWQWYNTCDPNCAAGNYLYYDVGVRLTDVRVRHGFRYFASMNLTGGRWGSHQITPPPR